MERTCKTCGETKPLEVFRKQADCSLGYRHICKACFNIKNRDKQAVYFNDWKVANREKYNAYQAAWQRAYRKRKRDEKLKDQDHDQ